MTRKRAIDRRIEETGWSPEYRDALEKIVLRLTDSADSLDADTYEAVKQYIINYR